MKIVETVAQIQFINTHIKDIKWIMEKDINLPLDRIQDGYMFRYNRTKDSNSQ